MSPVDAAILRRKLQRIITSLERLKPLAGLSPEEYEAKFYERKAAERLLQEAIEAALDINAHLIAELGRELPSDSYSSFAMMAELGVLPKDLAAELSPSAGLRNRLVHEYELIDDLKVLAAIAKMLETHPRYVKSVEEFIEDAGF